MKTLRTAIIGCGNFARQHALTLSKLENIALVGFCDIDENRAHAFNQEFAQNTGTVFTDYKPLFSKLDLDLAYICLPPFARENEVQLACEHGVNLFIEKPIALNMALAESMAKWVRESDIKCQVGFKYRFGRAARWLKSYLQDQKNESHGFMVASYACNSLHAEWWRRRELSGGQLVEQVIHLLDISRFFLGNPVEVFSLQDNLFHKDIPDYSIEDASITTIRFDSGSMAAITATNGAIPNKWAYGWKMYTKELTADFSDPNHAEFYHTTKEGVPTTNISADDDLHLAESLDLIQAIYEDREPAIPIEEGVQSLQLALMAAKSAEFGTSVKFQ
jgi:predicted dehydrogenase